MIVQAFEMIDLIASHTADAIPLMLSHTFDHLPVNRFPNRSTKLRSTCHALATMFLMTSQTAPMIAAIWSQWSWKNPTSADMASMTSPNQAWITGQM